jgi:hypothetical protein
MNEKVLVGPKFGTFIYRKWVTNIWVVTCMSPQKLLFCYHLPTRGRAGVKLGDA